MIPKMKFLELLEKLRVIGQNGLQYADNPYGEERYERILELVSQRYGKTLEFLPEKCVIGSGRS